MSEMQQAAQSPWRPVRRVAVGVFVFVMAFLYLRGYLELVRVNYQISVVERELKAWEAKCDELRREIEYLSSPEYVEKAAREELGLVKPGEVPVIVAQPQAPDSEPGVTERPGGRPEDIRD